MLENYKKITKKEAREMLNGKKVLRTLCIWIDKNNKDANLKVVNNLKENEYHDIFINDNKNNANITVVKSNHIEFIKKDGNKSYLYHKKGEQWYVNDNTVAWLEFNECNELITILVYDIIEG